MTDDKQKKETFEEFKNSFSYSKRTDLNFKFLANLEPENAADFFQDLLWKLGDTFNDSNLQRIYKHVYDWQIKAYSKPGKWTYEDGPFIPLSKPISQSRITLLTSSGHFIESDDPEPFGVCNMTQAEAIKKIGDFIKCEPDLAVIPSGTAESDLRVRHGGYDIRAAQADPNIAFPLALLRELLNDERNGVIADNAYSFIGACSQMKLLKKSAPRWAQSLLDDNIDAAVLAPV